MKVIVGLGNPGKKYDNTRHNIGFEALDYIADKEGISINTGKHKALIGTGYMGGQKKNRQSLRNVLMKCTMQYS